MDKEVRVIGAGHAGSEAAWQLANRGFKVTLYEMKPVKYSPAHKSPLFAELVCSNSLKSADTASACGMLKEEMRYMNSITMEAAEKTRVAAGGALAVNRDEFSLYITEKLKNHPNITIEEKEITAIPDENTVIATGPLTSDNLAAAIQERFGKSLSFYDAAAPIITAESIDMSVAFFATRYDKGEADYINITVYESG